MSGLIVHPFAEAAELLPQFRRIVATAPDELTVWAVMRKAPPLPFLPAEWHGKEVLIFAACYSGDMKEGEKAMQPLRALGKPIADVIGAASLHRLAGRLRSAADAGRAQLLEEPRFRRPVRRRRSTTIVDAAARLAVARNARSSSRMSAAPWPASRPMRPPIRTASRISS